MDASALPISPHYTTAIYTGSTTWATWTRPPGKRYALIIATGGGGGGGAGAIGAVSTAAGGGGGGAGATTVVEMPLDLLPPRLYISASFAKAGAGVASYVSTRPDTVGNHVVAVAAGGAVGGNASGATAGGAGSGAAIPTASLMSLGWAFLKNAIAGPAGIAGGTTGSGIGTALPNTGTRVTGGTGGGGLPASGNGTGGGSYGAFAYPSYFPAPQGGVGATAATTPPSQGVHGIRLDTGIGSYFYYGGTGGGSTFATATGAGLVQGRGGNGAIGSGGGGSGGALTGSTAAAPSYGGAGQVMILCY